MEKDKEKNLGITAKKDKDFSEWYVQAILKAELADYSSVKGCMVIRPYGYAMWEKIQAYFNKRLNEIGVKNAYFPLFIPESFFKKEAEHAEGFSPEVAWISNREEERLAVRPTSETVIYDSYSKWIRSWRDLPLRINQWCNVVRWETKAVKLFLRTREFLWQEGHCVYETKEECDKETLLMLKEYQKMSEELLAIPVLIGRKTEKEKFAGALYTTTFESLMPDGKALQMGTSHNLGQGFAKAFGISFLGKDGKEHIPWQNCWGISTRLIGAVVMVHGDDKGLVLPPKIAPVQVAIVPITFEKDSKEVLKKAEEIKSSLNEFSVELDEREYNPGWKFNYWELKGVPLRIEIGARDIEKGQAVLVRRDTGKKEAVKINDVKSEVKNLLDEIQKNLFKKAEKFLNESIVEVKTWNEFLKAVKNRKMAKAAFCGEIGCEEKIREESEATSRLVSPEEKAHGKCVRCGKEAKVVAFFSKAY